MPFFSIILPTHNRAHFLPKAVESVLTQTFEDWELVIVDDGSTDNTKEVVLAYQDPRIIYIYQENQERSAARNNGISKARGEYICFLDSDDYYLPNKLMNFRNFLVNDLEICVLYDNVLLEDTNKVRNLSTKFSERNTENVFENLVLQPLFCQQVCFKKCVGDQFKFDTRFKNNEDMELWLRIAKHYEFTHLKTSFETVIVEHVGRSINNLTTFEIKQTLFLYKWILSSNHSGKFISRSFKRKVRSNLFFNIAKVKMRQSGKIESIYWILKSIISDVNNIRNKHLLFCLKKLFVNSIPDEYRIK
jgi:glycosyltransferase involved in cell wall biosynthesis